MDISLLNHLTHRYTAGDLIGRFIRRRQAQAKGTCGLASKNRVPNGTSKKSINIPWFIIMLKIVESFHP